MDGCGRPLAGVDPDQILGAVESFSSPGASGVPPQPAILAIGGSAAPDDVARALTGGRPARAAGGHTLVLYDTPEAAARAVAGFLRPRAMTMVRFGLHVGEVTPAADGARLAGPAVRAATRLADLAGPGRLRVSPEAAALLGGSVPVEAAVDGSYEMREH